jgi:molecular chaperone DnaJ
MSEHYNTLGISKNANQDEIKKAYKKQAKKYHPDLNKDNPKAEEKFKEVNQAYKVLSDEKTRSQYDQFGHEAYTQGQKNGGFGGGQQGGYSGFDASGFGGFEDIFSDFFGGGFGGRGRQQRGGQDLQAQVNITLKEAYTGCERTIEVTKYDVCDSCEGTGAKDKQMDTCKTCKGQGRVLQQQQTPFGTFRTEAVCPTCQGQGKTAKEPCNKCNGNGRVRKNKSITVDIPKGVETGQRIRVSGEGEAGPAGTPPGDLYLLVQVKQHEFFKREGSTLHAEVPISFAQATFGDDVEIPTLEGSATLEIPQGTQTHTTFRLRKYGMPTVRGAKGDLHIKVKVKTPEKLTTEQKEVLKSFSELRGEDTKPQKGFFERIKDVF